MRICVMVLLSLSLFLIPEYHSFAQRKGKSAKSKTPSQPKTQQNIEQPLSEDANSSLPLLMSKIDSWVWMARLAARKSITGVSVDDTVAKIEAWLQNAPGQDDKEGSARRHELIKKNFSSLSGLLEALAIPRKIEGFLYSNNDKDIPIYFVRHRDGGLTLAVSAAFYGSKFNTLRVGVKERAAEVIKVVALSSLSIMYVRSFSVLMDVKYYCIVIAYSCQDFLTRKSDEEAVAIVMSTENARKFYNKEITDEELIESSDIYISESGTSVTDVKKIKLP